MRMIVTGVSDGKSCVVREIDCTPEGDGLSTINALSLDLDALPPRPPGTGAFVDIPVPPGS